MQPFAMFGYYMLVHESSCMLLLDREAISSLSPLQHGRKQKGEASEQACTYSYFSRVSEAELKHNISVLVLDHPAEVSNKQPTAPPTAAWAWICL